MPVKYLSQEWVDEYNAVLAKDDAVHAALKGKNAALQMVISDSPQGEIRYWLRIADGSASQAWATLPTRRSPSASLTRRRPSSTRASWTGRRRSRKARLRLRARC